VGNPPYGSGPARDLCPGWSFSEGGFPLDSIFYNTGKTAIFERAVLEAWFPWIADLPPPDNGKYGLFFNHMGGHPSYEIVQRGDVPSDARLLQINGYHFGTSGYFTATMDGVPAFPGDISAFAGKNVELKITSQSPIPTGPPYPAGTPVSFIDSISFFHVSNMGLTIASTSPANGEAARVTIRFNPEPGHEYFVEYHDVLDLYPSIRRPWLVLPGAPHNSGTVIDSSTDVQRYYRVRSELTAQAAP
jgi:hypothetical protein